MTKTETMRVKDGLVDWGQEIEVEFNNLENPGVMIEFVYGSTKDFKKYKLMHGAKVKLPEAVIRHLESCVTPIYKYLPDASTGAIGKKHAGNKPRFSCRRVW